ncbi:unnamed protein product [Dicrocoelium dendriticum]|nr:unnamed protein product [Dicrocoelium dendriticum]
MGSCASTGVSRVESPIRSVREQRHQESVASSQTRSPSRNFPCFSPKEAKQNHTQFTSHLSSSVEMLEMGRGDQDVPLRTVGPLVTDAQLDQACIDLEISPTYYKNLANSSLEEYARLSSGTDQLHTSHTPEAMRACYTRMRQVYEAIEQDRMGKATLLKNLHYAITIMEASYISEKKRIREEDDDWSEAATEYVPDEVRDWLATTFTRTQSSSGIDQKPRFRSVANAIRAGIVVERIYRRMSSCANLVIPPNVLLCLKAGRRHKEGAVRMRFIIQK